MGWLGKFYKITFISFLIFVFSVICPRFSVISAQTVGGKSSEELQNEIKEYENKLNEISKKKNTLASQIEYMNTQIKLTALRINETEESVEELKKQISGLSIKIETLEGSLSSVSRILLDRIVATYKAREVSPIYIFFSSSGFNDFLNKAKYLQIAQANDKKLLYAIESTKTSYKKQKNLREEKKEELEGLQEKLKGQKAVLGQQKTAKENLLEVTKNDEKKYQELLAAARAELEAIQAIIAGKGKEEEVGKVNQGDRIASIIQGPSCNSSGAHLHFIVQEGGIAHNPFNYLRGGIDYENCSGPKCGEEGDAFNPTGDWEWPINPKIKFTQGFGRTWAVDNTWVGRIYSSHNGIDIYSESSGDVKAVKGGTLYRGSYTGYNGCRLRYVRVDHDDSDLNTLYLHVNYINL